MVLKVDCELPDHGIFVNPQGIITSCCVSMQNPFGDFNTDSSSAIWTNETARTFRKDFHSGNLPKSCKRCIKNKESLRGNKSKIIKDLKTKESKIVHADITLGNVCQLSCTMCGPTWSHTWAKIKNEAHRSWHMSKEKMYELLDTIEGVKYVEIKGGEPFLMPYFDEFISELHRQNPDVKVQLLTNGLHINKQHIKQLKKLKDIDIGFSAEASGDLYRYIRGGSYKFNDVLENIKILKSELDLKNVHLSSILSFYNITKWVEQHTEIQQRLNDLGLKTFYSCNTVKDPLDQSVYLTKPRIRRKWLNDLGKSDINLNKRNYNYLRKDKQVDISRDQIINSIKYYDNLRNMSLISIVPNLLDTLDERYK